MKIRKYSVNPRQVRLFEVQEDTLDRMFRDKTYCGKKGFGSVADVIRIALTKHLMEYEEYEFRKSVSS